MKVIEVIGGDIPATFVKRNHMKLIEDYKLSVLTDEGMLEYKYKKGFTWNGRSGSNFPISLLLPRWGNQGYQKCILLHDTNFDCHFLSYKLSNELFYNMLINTKVKKWIAKLGLRAVSSKIGEYLYYNDIDKINLDKVTFNWSAK